MVAVLETLDQGAIRKYPEVLNGRDTHKKETTACSRTTQLLPSNLGKRVREMNDWGLRIMLEQSRSEKTLSFEPESSRYLRYLNDTAGFSLANPPLFTENHYLDSRTERLFLKNLTLIYSKILLFLLKNSSFYLLKFIFKWGNYYNIVLVFLLYDSSNHA